jgi:hypothetical protein
LQSKENMAADEIHAATMKAKYDSANPEVGLIMAKLLARGEIRKLIWLICNGWERSRNSRHGHAPPPSLPPPPADFRTEELQLAIHFGIYLHLHATWE